ncbi:hypothetical protein I7I53_05684 [Histoplasma capsulatum var. duboisii H88]|uniref:Uncharacterized protein n=1 Tax=Ajellomyces capsulatus (strain H88) TaxID=544711 RepID=A0A8A1LSP8_AJEC8|nr:hypothetical protein I7I53_05684 [Histoplasma capsulatum var. duboisii H88]
MRFCAPLMCVLWPVLYWSCAGIFLVSCKPIILMKGYFKRICKLDNLSVLALRILNLILSGSCLNHLICFVSTGA